MYLQVVYESDSAAGDRENTLHGPVFSSVLQMRSDEFDMEFEEKFELEKKGYSKDKIQFAKSAMSNMIGEYVVRSLFHPVFCIGNV